MPGSQLRMRASVFYLGSALFLGTGMVSMADQPFGNGPPEECHGCTKELDFGGCYFNGVVCTGSNHFTCAECACSPTAMEEVGFCVGA